MELGAAAVAEILCNDHGDGGSQQVQGCAADGLVSLQVDEIGRASCRERV